MKPVKTFRDLEWPTEKRGIKEISALLFDRFLLEVERYYGEIPMIYNVKLTGHSLTESDVTELMKKIQELEKR